MPYRRKGSPVWWTSYTDAGGRRVRRTTGTTDRKEAEALEAKWKHEAYRAKFWDEKPSRSFDELMLAYLEATEREKRSAERDIYSTRHLKRFFSGRLLNDLGPLDVRAYVQARKAEGASQATVKREVGLFSSAINYARREWGWEVTNPCQGLRLKTPEGRLRWLTREEAGRLLECARQVRHADHLPDFIRLGLYTGMRRGEMLGLEWSRVDFREGLIYLEGQHQKNGKRGSVPINAEARAALLSRMAFRKEHCPEGRWVFCNRKGQRIASVKKSFAAACRLARIEDFRIHDLRHTCAAWLVQIGTKLPEIMELLRHADIKTTMRYAHLAPENVRAAVDRLVLAQSGHIAAVE